MDELYLRQRRILQLLDNYYPKIVESYAEFLNR